MERDFFGNAFDKAKNAFEVAYKKTGEVLSAEKIKFNISSLKSKREKAYAKLGKSFFEGLGETVALNDQDKAVYDEIVELNTKIEDLTNELNFVKSNRLCPSCGAVIDESSLQTYNYYHQKIRGEEG